MSAAPKIGLLVMAYGTAPNLQAMRAGKPEHAARPGAKGMLVG